jgi:hypothetical protein
MYIFVMIYDNKYIKMLKVTFFSGRERYIIVTK